MDDRLTVGVIGAGRIGRIHAENLSRSVGRAKLATVSDSSETAAENCARLCPGVATTTDYHSILADPSVQAVVICSPTDTHAQIIQEAAEAGKHIFCEKPIAHDLHTIDRALAAVDEAGVSLQVGFNRRFDAEFQRVRKSVATREIGEPHMVHIVSRDPSPPSIDYVKRSGGLFLDMTIHDFDMARFLVGSEVEEVYATGGVRIDPAIGEAGDIDTAVTVLKFKNGVIGTIDNSRQAVYGYDQRVEVFGSEGSIRTENKAPNTVTVSGKCSVRHDLPVHFFMERYKESFREEMRQFVDAVLDGHPVPVTGMDGRVPVVMAKAAHKSYEENRPVKLSEVGRHKEEIVSVKCKGRAIDKNYMFKEQ